MASFDRAILPGGEGKITLVVKTKDFQGEIHKTAKVYTNDPLSRIQELGIRAIVEVPIYIYPKTVYLQGMAGEQITKMAVVTAGKKESLRLEPGYFSLNEQIRYRIEEAEAGKVFWIHFTSIPGPAGNYRGVLKLKTNYPDKPEIDIPIMAKFRAEKGEVRKNATQ